MEVLGMSRLVWLLGVMCAACVGVTGAISGCTEYDIDVCWTPMQNLPEHLTWTSVVPTLPKEQMKEHCRLFDSVEVCLKDLEDQCGLLDNKAHQGIISAYSWLCDEAFDEYLLYRECFSNTDLHREGAACNQTLISKLDGIDDGRGTDYSLQRICQYANGYLDCVENAVTAFCGLEAGLWQRKLDTRNIQPIMTLANCQLDNNGRVYYAYENKTRTYIIIGCIAAITLILILLTISIVVMYRSRKFQDRTRRAQAQANGQVNYTNGAGGVAIPSVTASAGQDQQAGPLPQKFPEPPPYDSSASPLPVYTTPNAPNRTSGAYDYVDMSGGAQGAAAAPGSTLSKPPPYMEKQLPPSDNTVPVANSNAGGNDAQLGMDNPTYFDFSKEQG